MEVCFENIYSLRSTLIAWKAIDVFETVSTLGGDAQFVPCYQQLASLLPRLQTSTSLIVQCVSFGHWNFQTVGYTRITRDSARFGLVTSSLRHSQSALPAAPLRPPLAKNEATSCKFFSAVRAWSDMQTSTGLQSSFVTEEEEKIIIKCTAFCNAMPCGLVLGYERFGRTDFLHTLLH